MGAAPSYKYEPLRYEDDEIRLLQIVPGSQHYRLEPHVSLRKSRPQYFALSYTWGLDHRQSWGHSIVGNHLLISVNLHLALQEVATFHHATHGQHKKPLALCVDQICINQSNDEEKNHQVALMSMIYDRAEEVLI